MVLAVCWQGVGTSTSGHLAHRGSRSVQTDAEAKGGAVLYRVTNQHRLPAVGVVCQQWESAQSAQTWSRSRGVQCQGKLASHLPVLLAGFTDGAHQANRIAP